MFIQRQRKSRWFLGNLSICVESSSWAQIYFAWLAVAPSHNDFIGQTENAICIMWLFHTTLASETAIQMTIYLVWHIHIKPKSPWFINELIRIQWTEFRTDCTHSRYIIAQIKSLVPNVIAIWIEYTAGWKCRQQLGYTRMRIFNKLMHFTREWEQPVYSIYFRRQLFVSWNDGLRKEGFSCGSFNWL